MSWFSKPKLVGIDVGSRTVKAVALKEKKGQIALDQFFFYDLADGNPRFPEGGDVGDALRAGVEIQRLEDSHSAASLPDRQMMQLELNLPVMPAGELRSAVKHELSEMTGIELGDLAFDFFVTSQAREISVRAFGAHKKHVDDLVKTIKEAKLQPTRVETDTIAITAALTFNKYIEEEKIYAVFDLGEQHITAALIAGGELRLSKSFDKGGGTINRSLIDRFGLNYVQAEFRKKKYDFSTASSGEHEIEQAIDEAYAGIFSDIKAALNMFADAGEKNKVDQILLTGGGSMAPNLPRVLEMFFKVPALVANPFRHIQLYADGKTDVSAAAAAPYLMTATGLALSAFPGKKAA